MACSPLAPPILPTPARAPAVQPWRTAATRRTCLRARCALSWTPPRLRRRWRRTGWRWRHGRTSTCVGAGLPGGADGRRWCGELRLGRFAAAPCWLALNFRSSHCRRAPTRPAQVPDALLPDEAVEALVAARPPAYVALDGTPLPPGAPVYTLGHGGVVQMRLANGIKVNYRVTDNEPRGAMLRLVAAGGRATEGQGVGPLGTGSMALGTRTLSEAGTVGAWSREQVRAGGCGGGGGGGTCCTPPNSDALPRRPSPSLLPHCHPCFPPPPPSPPTHHSTTHRWSSSASPSSSTVCWRRTRSLCAWTSTLLSPTEACPLCCRCAAAAQLPPAGLPCLRPPHPPAGRGLQGGAECARGRVFMALCSRPPALPRPLCSCCTCSWSSRGGRVRPWSAASNSTCPTTAPYPSRWSAPPPTASWQPCWGPTAGSGAGGRRGACWPLRRGRAALGGVQACGLRPPTPCRLIARCKTAARHPAPARCPTPTPTSCLAQGPQPRGDCGAGPAGHARDGDETDARGQCGGGCGATLRHAVGARVAAAAADEQPAAAADSAWPAVPPALPACPPRRCLSWATLTLLSWRRAC